MKQRKMIFVVLMVILTIGVSFTVNIFWGNPISKSKAQVEAVRYFEDTYKVKFNIYKSQYNPEIPAYIFYMGPAKDEKIRFDTGLYCQGITDPYGGILASEKLKKDLGEILNPKFGFLNFRMTAKEDPLVWYAGETANYFDVNPESRVQKNHYYVEIIWKDNGMKSAELSKTSIEMKNMIEKQLPYKTPNLEIIIIVKDNQNLDSQIYTERLAFFSTMPTE